MATVAQPGSPTLDRLEDQIGWYGRKSKRNQRWYKWLKGLTIVAAVLVPVLSTYTWGPPYAGALGIVIAIAEGLQQLNQFQANWISYRSTCESLKHEKYLFLADAGSYAGADNPLRLLAERIEALVSQEGAKWVSGQQDADKKPAVASTT